VGDHSCNDLNHHKTKSYLGSGRYFLHAKKEYGKENFKREILLFFPTKKEAFDAQEKYITQFNTLYPNGYNLSPTGGIGVKGCCSAETKKKIGDANRGRIPGKETREKMAASRTGNKNGMYDKNHSIESCIKMGQTKKEKGCGIAEKNGMFGKSLFEHWKIKFGEKIALYWYQTRRCHGNVKLGSKN